MKRIKTEKAEGHMLRRGLPHIIQGEYRTPGSAKGRIVIWRPIDFSV